MGRIIVTVTQRRGAEAFAPDTPAPALRCKWCRRPLTTGSGSGRPRVYCKQACRQRDYEARRRAAERGAGEYELVVAREALEVLRDRLFVLERTLEDAGNDLRQPEARKPTELRRVLRYVLETAQECVQA